MERNWTYRDELGAEYGPYSREELERYAKEGRVSSGGQVKGPDASWVTPDQAGLVIPMAEPEERMHPATDSNQAIQESLGSKRPKSPHQRILYILLGILLPLFLGLPGINNLIVGRTSNGTIQLVLGLCGIVGMFLGGIFIFPLCIGIPLWLGILVWSIIEAATNTLDGEGRVME
ncbi:MAG: GYF domain-containing protein [Phycisphaerales bacterium]|nr:GYF domain-containing protein [Phycisphaerales bacterium]